jgi:histidinol-phosphatase (PHP family)
MVLACERAVRIGLPAVIFTEHVDLEPAWRSTPDDLLPHQRVFLDNDDHVRVPTFDVHGYLDSIAECRGRFPGLRILTGLEFGQPHLRGAALAGVLDPNLFDRINGSLHTLTDGADRCEPNTLYRTWEPDAVIEAYLAEMVVMAGSPVRFETVTHLDYAVRAWPTERVGPFDPCRFESGFRAAMRAIADSGRALEMNTGRLWPWLPRWWAQEGGRSITFGSDAHDPELVARNFPEAAEMVTALGFRPGEQPEDPWRR